MTDKPYIVSIVVDQEYGEKLSQLPSDQPVWIVDTPANRAAAGCIWANRTNANHLTGVTTFKCDPMRSGEEALIGEFDTMDLHHGEYSAQPPYTVVEVIGAQLSDAIKTTLSEYGFNDYQPTSEGFRAVRPLPE